MNDENEMIIPIRPKELGTVTCMVHGEVEIDLSQIKYFRNIRADNDCTTQIFMNSGESYYIRGENMRDVSSKLGIKHLQPYEP